MIRWLLVATTSFVLVFPTVAAAQTWQSVHLPEVGTRARLPGRAEIVRRPSQSNQGYLVEMTTAEVIGRRGWFGVLVFDIEGGLVSFPDRVADDYTRPLLHDLRDPQREHRRLSLPGFYADELRLEEDDAITLVRRAVGQRRVYLAFAQVAPSDVGMARTTVRSLRPDPDDAFYAIRRTPEPSRDWTLVRVPHERFAIRMPTPNRDVLATVRLSDALRVPGRIVEGQDADAIYRVRSLRVDDPSRLSAETIAATVSAGSNATPVHAHGFPDVEIRDEEGGRVVRVFRVSGGWLVLEVIPQTDDPPSGTDAFFSSLFLD